MHNSVFSNATFICILHAGLILDWTIATLFFMKMILCNIKYGKIGTFVSLFIPLMSTWFPYNTTFFFWSLVKKLVALLCAFTFLSFIFMFVRILLMARILKKWLSSSCSKNSAIVTLLSISFVTITLSRSLCHLDAIGSDFMCLQRNDASSIKVQACFVFTYCSFSSRVLD